MTQQPENPQTKTRKEVPGWVYYLLAFGLIMLMVIGQDKNVSRTNPSAAQIQQDVAAEAKQKAVDFIQACQVGPRSQMKGYAYYEVAKKMVLSQLKAPSTAKFADYDDAHFLAWIDKKTGDCMWKVGSWVDSQNSFGAMLRQKFSILFRYPKDGSDRRVEEAVMF